jgi:uncharacterized tellurite resistance protein B-like protein
MNTNQDWKSESVDYDQKMCVLDSLFYMAAQDGNVCANELQAISGIAMSYGLSPEDVKHYMANHESVEVKFPDTQGDRAVMLYHLFEVADADGVIHEKEEQFFNCLANRLEFVPGEFGIMQKLVQEEGYSPQQLSAFFNHPDYVSVRETLNNE